MKKIGSPKNGNICAFFAKCRESSVRAFRKKTPISVRRCGEGGLREVWKKSAVLWLFYIDGFPKGNMKRKIWDKYGLGWVRLGWQVVVCRAHRSTIPHCYVSPLLLASRLLSMFTASFDMCTIYLNVGTLAVDRKWTQYVDTWWIGVVCVSLCATLVDSVVFIVVQLKFLQSHLLLAKQFVVKGGRL